MTSLFSSKLWLLFSVFNLLCLEFSLSVETGADTGRRGPRCPRACSCNKGEATCSSLKTVHIRKILNKLPRNTHTLIIRDTQFSKNDDPDSIVNIVQKGTFKSKPLGKKLKKLVLDGNSITHVSAASFDLPNLKTLILSNNNLRAVEQETFVGIGNS